MNKQKSDDYEDEILELDFFELGRLILGLGDNYRTGLKSQNQNKFYSWDRLIKFNLANFK